MTYLKLQKCITERKFSPRCTFYHSRFPLYFTCDNPNGGRHVSSPSLIRLCLGFIHGPLTENKAGRREKAGLRIRIRSNPVFFDGRIGIRGFLNGRIRIRVN